MNIYFYINKIKNCPRIELLDIKIFNNPFLNPNFRIIVCEYGDYTKIQKIDNIKLLNNEDLVCTIIKFKFIDSIFAISCFNCLIHRAFSYVNSSSSFFLNDKRMDFTSIFNDNNFTNFNKNLLLEVLYFNKEVNEILFFYNDKSIMFNVLQACIYTETPYTLPEENLGVEMTRRQKVISSEISETDDNL